MGPQGQGGFHSESQLQPRSQRPIKTGQYILTMTITAPHQLYLLIYKFATLAALNNTVTALLEYLDFTTLLEYNYPSFKQVFKGLLMGPLSGWGPRKNGPVPPPPVGSPDSWYNKVTTKRSSTTYNFITHV